MTLHFDPLKLATKRDEPGERGEPVYEISNDDLYTHMLAAITAGGEPTPGEDAGRYAGFLKSCRAAEQAMADAALECEIQEVDVEHDVTIGGEIVEGSGVVIGGKRERRVVRVKVPVVVATSLSPERREARAKVLETCRLWFTNELHQAVGRGPLKLRITTTEASKARWKL